MIGNKAVLRILIFLTVTCSFLESCKNETSPPIDKTISIGSYSLQIHQAGKGSPCVVIDAGLGDRLDKWEAIQDTIANLTQVITYNRAGYGHSEAGPKPRDGGREAEELKMLLENASISGPFVLVGHSLGALNAQVFASKYPDQVAGMVLLDPPPLPFILGQKYRNLEAMAEQMTTEWQTLADSMAESIDAQQQAQSKFFDMIASEHREMFGTTAKMVNSISTFGDIPLTVIAAGKPNPAFGEDAEAFQEFWVDQSRKLAEKSLSGKFVLAEQASHQLYLDNPGLITKTIISMVRQARKK